MKNPESEFSKPPRESAVSRVITNSPEEEKFMLEHFQSIFENQPLASVEREKTPEELELINQLNEQLKHFVESYGGSWIEVRPENIHILDKQKVEKLEDKGKKESIEKMMDAVSGGFTLDTQTVVIFNDSPRLQLVNTLVHEMLHFNSFVSYGRSIDKDVGFSTAPRRVGFNIYVKGESKPYFNRLDEAIIMELQKRFSWLNFDSLDFIKEEYNDLEEYRARQDLNGRPDLAKEAEYLDGPFVKTYSYSSEGKRLQAIIDGIYNENKEKFENKEEIFRLFAEAAMTGNLLPVARLIDKTYGRGAFKIIGKVTKMRDAEEKK